MTDKTGLNVISMALGRIDVTGKATVTIEAPVITRRLGGAAGRSRRRAARLPRRDRRPVQHAHASGRVSRQSTRRDNARAAAAADAAALADASVDQESGGVNRRTARHLAERPSMGSAMDATYLNYPFFIDGRGRTAATGRDRHIRQMIEQVLFTNPGERVNRPDFGCGLRRMVSCRTASRSPPPRRSWSRAAAVAAERDPGREGGGDGRRQRAHGLRRLHQPRKRRATDRPVHRSRIGEPPWACCSRRFAMTSRSGGL